MPCMQHDNIQIYYEMHGSGPPLMLIAGLASDSQSWLPLIPELSRQFTLILPDNRGVGRSSQECEISVSLMAEDCIALLRHLNLPRAALLGHSMGGMVALEVARRQPQMVERLMLAASAVRNSHRNNLLFDDWADRYATGIERHAWFRSILYWILSEGFFEGSQALDATLEYLCAYPWSQSPQAFRQQTQAIADFDASGWLHSICVPTCVIAAGRDLLLSPDQSRQLADSIPGAVLQIMADAPHSLHTEQPENFAGYVKEYLTAGAQMNSIPQQIRGG